MAGVKIEQGTLTHRKTLRLKGLLGIGVAQAVGHLTMLWVWAASSTKDGSLAGMTPTEIAEVSGWAGEPADFLAAMIDAGYIDEAPDGFRLHDWAENTGQIEAEAPPGGSTRTATEIQRAKAGREGRRGRESGGKQSPCAATKAACRGPAAAAEDGTTHRPRTGPGWTVLLEQHKPDAAALGT